MIAILVVITIIWRMKLLLGTFLLNVMEPICVHCPISTMNGRISLVVQRETFTPFLSFLLSFSVCLCIMWNIEYRQCLFKRHCEYNESMAPAQEVHHHPPTPERRRRRRKSNTEEECSVHQALVSYRFKHH